MGRQRYKKNQRILLIRGLSTPGKFPALLGWGTYRECLKYGYNLNIWSFDVGLPDDFFNDLCFCHDGFIYLILHQR